MIHFDPPILDTGTSIKAPQPSRLVRTRVRTLHQLQADLLEAAHAGDWAEVTILAKAVDGERRILRDTIRAAGTSDEDVRCIEAVL